MLRMWGGAIVGLAYMSYLMSLEDSSRARSAFCMGMCVYHAAAALIILHLFSDLKTQLPGSGLVGALVGALGVTLNADVQRKACALAAVIVHGYLGFGLYKSSQETTDEVRCIRTGHMRAEPRYARVATDCSAWATGSGGVGR